MCSATAHAQRLEKCAWAIDDCPSAETGEVCLGVLIDECACAVIGEACLSERIDDYACAQIGAGEN